VLVFEIVGCISRQDASWSSRRRIERFALRRSSSGGAEAPSTGVSRSKSSEPARGTVHLAWTTGRAGLGQRSESLVASRYD
jgi:hypothetical protein